MEGLVGSRGPEGPEGEDLQDSSVNTLMYRSLSCHPMSGSKPVGEDATGLQPAALG
jgi:hypothetical protein